MNLEQARRLARLSGEMFYTTFGYGEGVFQVYPGGRVIHYTPALRGYQRYKTLEAADRERVEKLREKFKEVLDGTK